MKIRNGFVSNSSSSSFVVHESTIGKDNFKKLIMKLEEYRDKTEDMAPYKYNHGWGENGKTFYTDRGYVIVEHHDINDSEFYDILKECGVDAKTAFYIDW
jgi:hypothetical protein